MTDHPGRRVGREAGLPARIVRLRTRAGLPQRTFARRVGVSRTLVSRWERGHQRPRPRALRRIAALGGVTVEWLLEGRHRPAATRLSPAQLAGALGLTQVVLRWATPLRRRRAGSPVKGRRRS